MEKSPVRSDAYLPEWKSALILYLRSVERVGSRFTLEGHFVLRAH